VGGAVVALSGGVDSSLPLALAVRALGTEKVLAVTAPGAVESEDDGESAATVARLLQVTRRVLALDSLEIPGFAENTPRCVATCAAGSSTPPWRVSVGGSGVLQG